MADFETQQNPYEDRITAILQKMAQPQGYSFDQIGNATQAAQYMALAGRQGQGVEDILNSVIRKPQQDQMNQEYQGAQGLYNLFEQKRANGDKQAQSLLDKVNLFTGGDPEGNAMFVNALHNDPEKIDPGNAVQVMTKLASIAKQSGYVSPEAQMNKLKIKEAQLGLGKTQAEINKLNQVDIPKPLSEAGKRQADINSGFIKTGEEGKIPITNLPDATTRKEAIDEQKIVLSSPDIVSNLSRARELNKSTFDTGLLSAKTKMSGSRAMGIDKNVLKKTAEYQNIIERQVVTQMKTMFTRPTEYETKLVQKIEGSLDSSIPERESILNEAINYLQQREQQSRDTLDALGVSIKEPTKNITGEQRNIPGGVLPSNVGNEDLQTPSGIKYRVVQ